MTPRGAGICGASGRVLRESQSRGQTLVPGCGSGHDVRKLAVQGAEVLRLDIAPAAVEKACLIEPVAMNLLLGRFSRSGA